MEKEQKSGPTGLFPDGKLNDADTGEIKIGIGIDRKKKLVILEFGEPVKWVGFSQFEAVSIAEIILAKAELLNGTGSEQAPQVGAGKN